MKKASKAVPDAADELRPEYAFDYTKAKANPYAARLKGRTVAVVLEPDVAAAFPSSGLSTGNCARLSPRCRGAPGSASLLEHEAVERGVE